MGGEARARLAFHHRGSVASISIAIDGRAVLVTGCWNLGNAGAANHATPILQALKERAALKVTHGSRGNVA